MTSVPAARHRVDRLWPDPATDLELDSAFADLELSELPDGRPLVAANMVTSIDGRAQLHGKAEGLGSRADRRLMQLYRAAFDAVASGAGTLRLDDFYSRLPADLARARSVAGRPAQPTAVIIAGETPIPVDRRWFGDANQPRVAVVGARSPHAGAEPLPGVETWVAPTAEPKPRWLLRRLAATGVRSLLLEGGPTINAAFLAAGVPDELYWTIGARLVGLDGLPMVAPLDLETSGLPGEARLVSVHRSGQELYLRYRLGSIGP